MAGINTAHIVAQKPFSIITTYVDMDKQLIDQMSLVQWKKQYTVAVRVVLASITSKPFSLYACSISCHCTTK